MSYLAEAGVPTVSADDVAREVFHDPGFRDSILAAVGLDGLQEDLRAAVRVRIGEDARARRSLNAVMHAEVLRRMLSRAAPGLTAFEIPLLIETCIQRHFDRTWVVTCGEAEQLRRLTARLGDEAAAAALIATQLRTPVKLAFADRIIRTDQPPSFVHRSAMEALAELGWGERG